MISDASSKFPKSKRLLKHADFQRVYQHGRRQFTGNMTVFSCGARRPTALESAARCEWDSRSARCWAERSSATASSAACARRYGCRGRPVDGPVDVVFNPRKSVLTLPFAELASEVARGLQLAAQRGARSEGAENEMKRCCNSCCGCTSDGFRRCCRTPAASCRPARSTRWKRSSAMARCGAAGWPSDACCAAIPLRARATIRCRRGRGTQHVCIWSWPVVGGSGVAVSARMAATRISLADGLNESAAHGRPRLCVRDSAANAAIDCRR